MNQDNYCDFDLKMIDEKILEASHEIMKSI